MQQMQGVDITHALHQQSLQQQSPASLLPLVGGPGDMLVDAVGSSQALSVLVQQPVYQVVVQYKSAGRPLHDAQRVWAHVGHSGWQFTEDLELFRSPQDPSCWTGIYRLQACRLANPSHVEVQMVFKGQMPQGHQQWDNNDGNNWQVVAELSHHEGMTMPPEVSRSSISGLLLLLQAFKLQGLLTGQQEELLRILACQHDTRLLKAYETVRGWADDAAAAGMLLSQTMYANRPGVHVVHVASEMVPIAKVGGLGDVVTSLAKAHQASGTLVEVIMPKYDCANYSAIDRLRRLTSFPVLWDGEEITTHAWCGVVEGLPVYLLEAEQPAAFFWRGQFYGEADDCERYMFFSRAALEFLLVMDRQPDVLHLHDWQSALVAPLLQHEYRARGLTRPRSLLTIHNIAFQGWMSPDMLAKAGLQPEALAQPHLMLDDSRPGFWHGRHDVSLMRGGVVFADKVTTVSPTYAQEVYKPEFGFGMQAVLGRHSHKFSGVLNGIDQHMWSPSDDPLLPPWGHYSANDTRGKAVCKAALLGELGMPHTDPATAEGGVGRPLVVIISRLTQQKGLPLMLHGMQVALSRGAQLIVLGSASEPEVAKQFEALQAAYHGGPDARIILRYDEGLAHRIYAAGDVILIPSFFEPCGLTQLIALRYGTIPVVNATGGLADTVRDVSNESVPEVERNGFVFYGREHADVEGALHRALDAYQHGQQWWREQLVPRAMRQDWSWSRSAHTYLDIYRSIMQ
ncbi:hypothetical protein OEZ85_002584 [Tetradesmus obliquus]|uniref:Starch synthase, chloroplastic/amyloplastic n=1 Tax=Tetradesmus obliquus TaxID=3088 RepID=A0ABY8TY20_TETOB|nr:hypothetical protein OEZ85_002584 [Tetradesmus obliquus]